MNKAEIVESVALEANITKAQASLVVDTVIKSIRNGSNRDGKVSLVGFGTFTKVTTKERMGRNPQTGAEVLIKSKEKVKFTPSKDFLN